VIILLLASLHMSRMRPCPKAQTPRRLRRHARESSVGTCEELRELDGQDDRLFERVLRALQPRHIVPLQAVAQAMSCNASYFTLLNAPQNCTGRARARVK
jgi:hypothetical protein